MEQDDLTRMLHGRNVPRAPQGLAERIIHQAVSALQEPARARNIWAEIGAMIALPHPSVALATTILFGLVVGFQAGDGLSLLGQDWSSFLDINEGGWL